MNCSWFKQTKKIDADSEAIQQIEFVGKLKNEGGTNADETKSIFILMALEKIKKSRLKVSQKSVTVL